MDILAQIIAVKQREIAAGKAATPLEDMRARAKAAPPPRPFAAALTDGGRLPVIAELKRRSPSKGVLCDPFVPADIAAAYADACAACLSVLTDAEFFGGAMDDMVTARAVSGLPVLRKDFMLDEWQLYESRAHGADAVLLIVAALAPDVLRRLASIAHELGMAVLVEVHDAAELAQALTLPAWTLLGINNRNLKTFHTDVQTTLDLLPAVRGAAGGGERVLVSESGIHTRTDIARLRDAGVNAFLIGEALVRAPRESLAALFEGEHPSVANQ